jgi:hypothetical protein
MAIPLMTDTVPLYIFSIANREGKTMKMEWFVVVNFIAGVTRAIIFLVLLDYFNIVNLVG